MKRKLPKHKIQSPINRILEDPIKEISRGKDRFQERKKILIYCEGKNTEPSYFNKFRLSAAKVKAFGEGKNTLNLVKKAVSLKNDFDEVWCVFDLDEHGKENFSKALKLAADEGLKVAYSIQAFEYWLILHFEDHQGGPMDRTQYAAKINKYLLPYSVEYNSDRRKIVNDDFFDLLSQIDSKTGEPRDIIAIKRAGRIFDKKKHINPCNTESCTTVFKLVEQLKNYH